MRPIDEEPVKEPSVVSTGVHSAAQAGMSKEEFITHWVSHYDVALGIEEFWPTVRVYVQNDVLPEGLPGAPEVSVGYDAVGEFIYEDQAACRANVDARVNGGHAADVAVAHADEFITWEPYTGNFGGEIIELGGVNRAPFKLFRCFARAEGTGYGTFETVLKRSQSLSVPVRRSRSARRPRFRSRRQAW